MRRWCWHDWTPWKTYVAMYTVSAFGRAPANVTKTRQARQCKRCGKEIHRTVEGADGAAYDEKLEGAFNNPKCA